MDNDPNKKETDLSFFNCFGLFALVLDISRGFFERVGPFIYDIFKVNDSQKFRRRKIILVFLISFSFLSRLLDYKSLVFCFLFLLLSALYFFIFHFKFFLKWIYYFIFVLFFLFYPTKERIYSSKEYFE
jgi:hypothetical protein